MLTVATWNVLHRVHGENWDEAVVRLWPEERARIDAITRTIAGLDAQVIALQEVSGDQLASLRTLGRTLLAFRYPRLPVLRRGGSQLHDPAEYLALVVDGPADEVAASEFADDAGKGLLAARVGAATIVGTHVSFGGHGRPQMQRLAELAASAPGAAIVLGDFNAGLATVAGVLGAEFTACDPGPSVPTRPRPDGATKSTSIDHVFVRAATPVDANVIDVRGLSDHNLVVARVRVGD